MNDSDMLSLAVIRFLGYGSTPYPRREKSRLVDEFGTEMARTLERDVSLILNELNELKPDWSVLTLKSAGDWVEEEMHRRHPNLTREALNALGWAFTWWWR